MKRGFWGISAGEERGMKEREFQEIMSGLTPVDKKYNMCVDKR